MSELNMDASAETARIIKDNWERVLHEVGDACASADRPEKDVHIVGVSKYVGPELTSQLVAAGCRILGENRPQVLWEKEAWFQEQAVSDYEWHMIGHLQRNKARRTIPMIHSLHSLDSLRLATCVDEEAARAGRSVEVFLDVNPTKDDTKTGIPIAQVAELIPKIQEYPNLNLTGLMAMSTLGASVEQTREEFAAVRKLREQLEEQFSELQLPNLSMGMSGDFREAIAEGATHVRIGTSLWKGILPSRS